MNKSDFIIGKWYIIYTKSGTNNYKLYIKISKIEHDRLFFVDDKYINNNNIYDSGISLDTSYIENYQLLTNLSEIQEYLPEDHPDKFTTQVQTKDDYKHLIKLLKQL